MLSWTAPACASTAAFPSSAHTYRLLIVKEPPPPSRPDLRRSRRCQIVLFVSSREMRLCGVSLFSSITIFRKLQNFLLPILTTSTSPSPPPACFSCRLRTLSRREPNYSKATTVAQGGKRNSRNLLIVELCCAINLLSSKAFVPSASFQIIPPFWHGNSN